MAAPAARTEQHFAVVLRVGPSNLDRVAQVLRDHLHLSLEEARARLARPPAEIAVGREEALAYAVASEAKAAGAQAEITSRQVAVPMRTVTLEAAGTKPLAVIAALRSEISLSIAEAKKIVESTPTVIATNVEDGPARALAAALENAGAKVTVR